jgi:hypothetical protein
MAILEDIVAHPPFVSYINHDGRFLFQHLAIEKSEILWVVKLPQN